MGVEFDFPQGMVPKDTAGWSRAARRARVAPTDGSVTPLSLSPDTTTLIDSTATAAADAAAAAAQAAAIAASNANATTLAASAQASAVSAAATALAAHVAALDPHTVYLNQTRGDARYLQQTLSLTNAVDDAAAATAGVAVGKLYRNGSVVQIRVV